MHAKGIKVVPFLSNHWDRTAGINALKDVETLSTQIADDIEKYNLDGVNVDIENVTHEQRDQYTQLVKLLQEKFQVIKKFLLRLQQIPMTGRPAGMVLTTTQHLLSMPDHLFSIDL